MSRQDFNSFLEREPFQPFRIITTNGTAHEIRHIEFVTVFPSRVDIAAPNPAAGIRSADKVISVALLHIVRIEPIEAVHAGS